MSSITASELQQRLSEQLQALSQVGETLTLRLLELEERMGGLEEQLLELDLRSDNTGECSTNTGELLAATEERIARLEDLLSAEGGSIHSSRSRVEPLPLRRPERHPAAGISDSPLAVAPDNEGSPDGEPELELDPFPHEDEEQPFMDELSA